MDSFNKGLETLQKSFDHCDGVILLKTKGIIQLIKYGRNYHDGSVKYSSQNELSDFIKQQFLEEDQNDCSVTMIVPLHKSAEAF